MDVALLPLDLGALRIAWMIGAGLLLLVAGMIVFEATKRWRRA